MADWFGREMSQAEWGAFVRWYTIKYKKPLPMEYIFTGRTPSGRLYDEFVADGRPGYKLSKAEAKASVEAQTKASAEARAKELETPAATPTGERKFIGEDEYEKWADGKWHRIEKTGMQSMAGGMLLFDRGTGKYIDPTNMQEVDYQDAQNIINQYNKQFEPGEAKAATPSQQQWEISKGRQEWAPGVNIEQDITTGKLYRPGSMVEVSPDIANVELLSTQSAQTLKRDWQEGAEAARLAEEKRQFDITQTRLNAQQDPELQRATNELRWEKDRIQLLSGLPSDDWVSRYILENQPNPYKKQPAGEVSASEQSLEDVLDFQTGNVEYQQKRLADAITSGASPETIAEFQGYLTELQKNRDATYTAWNAQKTEKRDWTPQPYPNAPGWLPPYAPGQTAGRMITPQNVPTPSGQQLTQMPRSRANQLGYFADWTARMGGGRNWRDILGEAELMQPFTPRGAGGFRTSPARQWV